MIPAWSAHSSRSLLGPEASRPLPWPGWLREDRALDCSQLPFLSASPAGGALFTGWGARLGLLNLRPRPRAIPGGLLVGGGQARGEEGRLPGHRGVREVLLSSPGEARQEVGGLLCCRVRWGVGAENLPLGLGVLAVTVQEKQQKGQEEQDGRGKKDAQEGLHVVFGGAYLLGALEFGNEAGLGEEERLLCSWSSSLWSFIPIFLNRSENHHAPFSVPVGLSPWEVK